MYFIHSNTFSTQKQSKNTFQISISRSRSFRSTRTLPFLSFFPRGLALARICLLVKKVQICVLVCEVSRVLFSPEGLRSYIIVLRFVSDAMREKYVLCNSASSSCVYRARVVNKSDETNTPKSALNSYRINIAHARDGWDM